MKDLVQRAMAAYPNAAIMLSGHSLGGAVVTLAALQLIKDGISVRNVYDFGTPRIGDQAFAVYADTVFGVKHQVSFT